MAEPLHRTQILLRRDQHRELSERASREGTSMSELVRRSLDETLARDETERSARVERRLDALRSVEEHRRETAAPSGEGSRPDVAELIREMREERDAELIRRIAPDRS
jgi:hypothetical protein